MFRALARASVALGTWATGRARTMASHQLLVPPPKALPGVASCEPTRWAPGAPSPTVVRNSQHTVRIYKMSHTPCTHGAGFPEKRAFQMGLEA